MSFEPRDYLRPILVETDFLIGKSAGVSAEEFMADETLRRAFVRSLKIVGEAAKKVLHQFRAQYPTVEWRAMAGMRDRLIHDHFGIDYELVWDVARKRIPELRVRLLRLSECNDPPAPTQPEHTRAPSTYESESYAAIAKYRLPASYFLAPYSSPAAI
jgi:uncharacterized protein with HEPN domain